MIERLGRDWFGFERLVRIGERLSGLESVVTIGVTTI
jgi:hypothetical protein